MSTNSSLKNDFISLPKGGGAITGIGEKFSADLHTGTGNFNIPISIPDGRNKFQPELTLQYSTGNPNGIAGLGWSLQMPEVRRKTSKGIPTYNDCNDIFVLSGFEDLVRTTDDNSIFGQFRPRTEGSFAHITFENNEKDSYWKVKNQNGLVSTYGSPNSPENDTSILSNGQNSAQKFAWRITQTTDPLGNKINYSYVDFANSCDGRYTESHIQQIDYINYIKSGKEEFLVSVQFEYEDRPDITSNFRSGFEIRLSKRIKHIIVTSNVDNALLVKKYRFEYDNTSLNKSSLLTKVQIIGFDETTQAEVIELAPIEFKYTGFDPSSPTITPIKGSLPAESLLSERLNLLDLDGNGLPDIVSINGQISCFKNNGDGTFGTERIMKRSPNVSMEKGHFAFLDANGDGRADILQLGVNAGYFSLEHDGEWDLQSFTHYKQSPNVNINDSNTKLVDLTGNGITDIVHSGQNFTYVFNDEVAEKAWKKTVTKQRENLSTFPNVNLSDPRISFADMTGDGMQDLVFTDGNSISYWPNKGYGNWGEKVRMAGLLKLPTLLELNRMLIGDLDGDGLADLVIIENQKIRLYINQGGKTWSEEIIITGTPLFSSGDDIRIVDLFGNGTSGILFSSNKRQQNSSNYYFLDLTKGFKPYLLNEVNNHLGAITRIEYSTSTKEFINDKLEGLKWKTHLPIPVDVVKKTETIDQVSKSKTTTSYSYHHGHWDGEEREFRGFGMVEQFDTETFDDNNSLSLFLNEIGFNSIEEKHFSPPSSLKTWFHLGPVRNTKGSWETIDYLDEFNVFDQPVFETSADTISELAKLSQPTHYRDTLRALSSKPIRTESFVHDEIERSNKPVVVQEFQYSQRIEQIPSESSEKPVVFTFPIAQRTTTWERGEDPKTQFTFTGEYNELGHPQTSTVVAMPRRLSKRINTIGKNYNEDLNENKILSSHTKTTYSNNISANTFIHDRICEVTKFDYLDTTASYFETDSNNLSQILKDQLIQAEQIHQVVFSKLLPSETKLAFHQLNYFDGHAFLGLPFKQIGTFGCLVRSEVLAFSDVELNSAYRNGFSADRRPVYLDGSAPSISKTPVNFGKNSGYTLKNTIPHKTGYYVQTEQYQFAFQQAGNQFFKGLLLSFKDSKGNETKIDYDKFDLLPTKVVDAIGNETLAVNSYQFFAPKTAIDLNKNKTNITYNSAGLPLKIWRENHDATQGGTVSKPDLSFSYNFKYDAQAKLPASISTVSRINHSLTPNTADDTIKMTEYSDGFGRVIQQIAQADNVLFGNLGDDNGLNKNQGGANQSAIGIVSPAGKTRTVVSGWTKFNNKGLPVEKYEPFFHDDFDFMDDAFFGKHVELYYDALGREQRILMPDGSQSLNVYGTISDLSKPENFEPSAWEHFLYDANDLDSANHKNTPSSTILDAFGRKTALINRNGQNQSADWLITKNAYDVRGNLIKTTDTKNRVAFTYQFDLLNRILRIDSIDGGKRTKVYDSQGNIIEYQDDKGSAILKEYDKLSRLAQTWARNDQSFNSLRLIEKIIYGDDPTLSSTITANNNLKGKPFKCFDEAGLTTYSSYDFKNNLLEKSRQIFQQQHLDSAIDWSTLNEGNLDPKTYQSTYSYDALNRISAFLYPADVNNHRALLKTEYNPSGKLRQILLDNNVFVDHLAYNAKNQRLLIAYGNKIVTRYAYDEDNFRLKRLRTESYISPNPFEFKPNGSVHQDIAYDYDLVGNITGIHHRENESGVSNDLNKLDRLFEYDALYQLISSSGRETDQQNPMADVMGLPKSSDPTVAKLYSEKYSYDEMGNFITLKHLQGSTQSVRTFTNEASNNRMKEVDYSGTVVKYIYDANGNLTDEGLSRRMSWDHSDRMSSFVIHDNNGNNSVEANYYYDAGGNRVVKKVKKGTNTVITITIDGLFEHTIDVTQNKENNHLHVMDDKSRIALSRVGDSMGDNKPAVQYHLGDHLGSSSICIGGNDSSGSTKISQEEYYPYGETSFGSHAKKRYRYSGKERDEESGMYYYGARYYMSWAARWVNCDPIGAAGGMNLYQFVKGNPMNLIDRMGFAPDGNDTDVVTVGAINTKNTILTDNPVDWENPDNIRLAENDQVMIINEGEDKSFNKTDPTYKWREVKILSGASEGKTGWIMEVLMDWDTVIPEQTFFDEDIDIPTTSSTPHKEGTGESSIVNDNRFGCSNGECVFGFSQKNGDNLAKVSRLEIKTGSDPNGFLGAKGSFALFHAEGKHVGVDNFTANAEAYWDNSPNEFKAGIGAQVTAIGGNITRIPILGTEVEIGASLGEGLGATVSTSIDDENQSHFGGTVDFLFFHIGISN